MALSVVEDRKPALVQSVSQRPLAPLWEKSYQDWGDNSGDGYPHPSQGWQQEGNTRKSWSWDAPAQQDKAGPALSPSALNQLSAQSTDQPLKHVLESSVPSCPCQKVQQ